MRADAAEYESDERFDVIVFNECLYYFDDPLALVRKYERFYATMASSSSRCTESTAPSGSGLHSFGCMRALTVFASARQRQIWNIKVMQPKPA